MVQWIIPVYTNWRAECNLEITYKLSMTKTAPNILALDIGGTKIAAAIVAETGEITTRKQEKTCQSGFDEGLIQIKHLLRELTTEASLNFGDIKCMGISIAARLDPNFDRIIWTPHIKGWENLDLRTILESELKIPVFLEFDGHAAVLGEWWMGSGKGYQNLIDVIIGTGIGGGIILDGKLYREHDRLAGTVSWFNLKTTTKIQDDQSQSFGFFESIASGPGLSFYAKQLVSEHQDSCLWSISQKESLTAIHIFEAVRKGDPFGKQLYYQLGDWLGLGIANIVSLLNPELVILGGGVGNQCKDLLPHIRQVVRQWAQPTSAQSVRITTSKLGTDAELLGAAYGALLRWEKIE